MKKEQITLIGIGWLGGPLCEKLSALGHKVIGTTKSNENIVDGNNIFSFDVTQEQPSELLTSSPVLIYTIPPMGLNEVETFFNFIDSNTKIIFISSTAVYGKLQGIVDENSSFDPNSPNAQVLRESESYLKKRFKHISIVRPGGLFAGTRHPVYFLAGRTGISTGDEFLHLVHRDDCVEAISKIVELNLFGEDFNLVNDLRILKKDYYTELAKKLNLAPPQFTSVSKQETYLPTKISNDKSKRLLGITYKTEAL